MILADRRWRRVSRIGLPHRSRGLVLGGVWLRVTTRWGAHRLDDQLALGADPMQSDQLSLRVGQLGSSKSRRRIALALRRAVAFAERGAYPTAIAAMPIRHAEVRANKELLLELADRLCASEPVGARGLAMTSKLIDDRRSPLYSGRSDGPLAVLASEALVAMGIGGPTNRR